MRPALRRTLTSHARTLRCISDGHGSHVPLCNFPRCSHAATAASELSSAPVPSTHHTRSPLSPPPMPPSPPSLPTPHFYSLTATVTTDLSLSPAYSTSTHVHHLPLTTHPPTSTPCRTAESYLQSVETQPGYGPQLLLLQTNDAVPGIIRQQVSGWVGGWAQTTLDGKETRQSDTFLWQRCLTARIILMTK